MNKINQTQEFIEFLEHQGIVSTDEIASLADLDCPEDVYETLVNRGGSDVELIKAYAQFNEVPFIELHEIDQKANSILDQKLQQKFGFIPFYVEENSKILQVALTDPVKYAALNRKVLDKIERRLGYKIEILLTPQSQADKVFKDDRPNPDGQITEEDHKAEQIFTGKVDLQMVKDIASSGDGANLLQSLLAYALSRRADELIFEPFENRISIKLILYGEKHSLLTIPSNLLEEVTLRAKTLARLNLEQTRVPQSGRFELNLSKDRPSNILFSSLPTISGERLSFKVLPNSDEIPQFKNLGMDESSLQKVERALNGGFGMVVVASVRKSGRSTTLASMMKELSTRGLDVISLEEEVTYTLEGVNQVVSKSEMGFGPAEALRAIFKQSPAVVAVDELTSHEEMSLVLHGALSGKLVLAGMFSKDATQALINLSNLTGEPYLISSAVKLIICQRLVRKICTHCKVEIEVSVSVEDKIKSELGSNDFVRFYRGEGCEHCQGGFSGRIALYEVLEVMDEIVDMIIAKTSYEEVRRAAIESGMITLRQDGLRKASLGLTTIDEVIKATRFEDSDG
ncbi:MAG: ATPase, T2SS/T4P/T4SS family [bacterium]